MSIQWSRNLSRAGAGGTPLSAIDSFPGSFPSSHSQTKYRKTSPENPTSMRAGPNTKVNMERRNGSSFATSFAREHFRRPLDGLACRKRRRRPSSLRASRPPAIAAQETP